MTEAAKHTPGPWETSGSHIYALDREIIIAVVYNPGSKASDYPLVANRDLMAAAPDMLSALRLAEGRIALLLREFPETSEVSDHPVATRYVHDQIVSAIAKAVQS